MSNLTISSNPAHQTYFESAAYNTETPRGIEILKFTNQPVCSSMCKTAIMGERIWDRGWNSKSLYSGLMKGCHLVIGINPENLDRQYFSHNNQYCHNTMQATNAFMESHRDWTYFLFLTRKTKDIEFQSKNTNLREFVSDINKNLYSAQFSKTFYVDDFGVNQIEVEYLPEKCKLKVNGIKESFPENSSPEVTARQAETILYDIPKKEKSQDLIEFQDFIIQKFQDDRGEISAEIQKLCEADTIEMMKEIAKNSQNYAPNKALRDLYGIILLPRATFYNMKNEINYIRIEEPSNNFGAKKSSRSDRSACCITM